MKLGKKSLFNLLITLIIFFSSTVVTNNENSKNSKNLKVTSKQDDVIFDSETALTFTKSLAKLIFDTPSVPEKLKEFNYYFDECFENFDNKPTEYVPVLKNFYLRCMEIKDDVEKKWNTNLFHSIVMTKLATVRIMQGKDESTCQVALPYSRNPDIDKIAKLFKAYFSQFVKTPKNAKPFITSQFATYRRKLPDDSFITLNKQSGSNQSAMYPKIPKSSFKDSEKKNDHVKITNANDKLV